MPAYWWKCGACAATAAFGDVSRSPGIAHFIWDELVPTNWDQSLRLLACPGCGGEHLRITYEFPRKDRVELTLVRAVGLDPNDDDYVPMMWETVPDWPSDDRWFDFKYVKGRRVFGLNKPAVFDREGLRKLFKLYCRVAKTEAFP